MQLVGKAWQSLEQKWLELFCHGSFKGNHKTDIEKAHQANMGGIP